MRSFCCNILPVWSLISLTYLPALAAVNVRSDNPLVGFGLAFTERVLMADPLFGSGLQTLTAMNPLTLLPHVLGALALTKPPTILFHVTVTLFALELVMSTWGGRSHV